MKCVCGHNKGWHCEAGNKGPCVFQPKDKRGRKFPLACECRKFRPAKPAKKRRKK